MNRLRGQISGIETNGHISLVDVAVGDLTFAAILLEAPQNSPYLAVGNAVTVLFKETEVSLAKNLSGLISLRNRIAATIKNIRHGEILSEVELDYRGQQLVSIVTSRSITRLELREGDAVEALIKANEVSLMEVEHGL
jgi:molybdate transport system regulatory protein